MKTTTKYITGILSILLLCMFTASTTYAGIFNFGRQSAGTHIWSTEGENTITACNNVSTCGTGTFRIDKGAPVITTTWTREEVSYNTLMQVTAKDGVSMVGGNLLVTQDNNKFNIGTPLVSGDEATVSITLKPDFINDIFETTFTVTAYDHLLKVSNQTFKVIYDGIAPVINVLENNTGNQQARFFLQAFAASDVAAKMRVAGLDEDADTTDNYGFLIKFIENGATGFSIPQTGIDEILYRYTSDPDFYPTELVDGVEESRINNLGITPAQANAIWYKQLPTDTDLKFSSQFRRELIELMDDEALSADQQTAVLALWDEIWKSDFYQVPSTESQLSETNVNKDEQLDTYLKIQESGRVLLEVRVVDAAGNVTSEIYNIHLDTKPLVKVYPLEWVNVTQGETITIELVNKYDNNRFYNKDTYEYFIRGYNSDGTVNQSAVYQNTITNGQEIIDEAAIGSLNLKGKYQLEVIYQNNTSEYTSDSFITNIYLDPTPVAEAADIVQKNEIEITHSACSPNNPTCTPTNTEPKVQTIKQVVDGQKVPNSARFVNYSPDFNIAAQNDDGGRSDVVSFALRKVANSTGTLAEEETQVFVFDTNGKQTLEYLDENEVDTLVTAKGITTESNDDNKDKLTRVVKDSVSEKVNTIYQSEVVDEVAKVLKVNELGGEDTLTSSIDTNEAQRKAIAYSVDDGLEKLKDEKGVREILSTEVPAVSFFQKGAKEKYTNTLTQLQNLLTSIEKQKEIIANQTIEIDEINTLVNEQYAVHAELYGQISDLSNQLRPKVEEINVLKGDYSSIHQQLIPYSNLESNYTWKKDELQRLISGHTQELNSLDSSYSNAPSRIQQYQREIQELTNRINNIRCWFFGRFCSDDKGNLQNQINYKNQEIARLQSLQVNYTSTRGNLISSYNTRKTDLDAQIAGIEQNLAIKKGLEDDLAFLTEQIVIKNTEIKELESQISAIDWDLSIKANSEDIIAATVRKQQLTKQNRILESFKIRNEKLILNTERNLYLLAQEAEIETTEVSTDVAIKKGKALPREVQAWLPDMLQKVVVENNINLEDKISGITLSKFISSFSDYDLYWFETDEDNQDQKDISSLATKVFDFDFQTYNMTSEFNFDGAYQFFITDSLESTKKEVTAEEALKILVKAAVASNDQEKFLRTNNTLNPFLNISDTELKTQATEVLENIKANQRELTFYEKPENFEKWAPQQIIDFVEENNIDLTKKFHSKYFTSFVETFYPTNTDLLSFIDSRMYGDLDHQHFYYYTSGLLNLGNNNLTSSEMFGKIFLINLYNYSVIDSVGQAPLITNSQETSYEVSSELARRINTIDALFTLTKAIIVNNDKENHTRFFDDESAFKVYLPSDIKEEGEKILQKLEESKAPTSPITSIINTIFGIQSTYAAPLDEGVYVLPDESLLIVDYTPPTGFISADGEVTDPTEPDPALRRGNAEKTGTNLFKPFEQPLTLGVNASDNFEEYGSFKSWTVTAQSGTHDNTLSNCNLAGASTEIDNSSNPGRTLYGNNIKVTDNIFITDTWGICTVYTVNMEDYSGNTYSTESEIIYADGIVPAFVTEPTISVATEVAPYKQCPTCDIESAWSNTPITVNWDITDEQSGFKDAYLTIIYNGGTPEVISLMQNYDLITDEDPLTTLEDTTINTIENFDQHIFGNYTTPADQEGYYEITMTFVDKSGNTVERTIAVKYDATSPVVDMNMSSTDGTNDVQMAGISTWDFAFNDENGIGATQVAQVVKENTTISFQKCTNTDCSTSTELTTVTGNTVSPEDANWVDSLTAATWNDWTSQQTISNLDFEIKHGAYYNDGSGPWLPENGGGKYKIILSVQDRAGNVTPLEKIITVEPNQRNTSSTVFNPATKCSDGTWQANGTDTCNITLSGRDQYNNPLYGKSVFVQGWSDSPLDSLHFTHADNDGGNQESVFFQGTISAQGIRDDKEYILDNNGDIIIPLVSFSPEGTTKQLDFTLKFTQHTAINYPNNTGNLGDYGLTEAENGKAYQSDIAFNFNWKDIPLFFQKNATQTISFDTTKNSVDSMNERIGLYVYTKTNGYYKVNNMESSDTIEDQDGSVNAAETEVSPWARAVNSNIQTTLGVSAADYNNDYGVIYSVEDTNPSHIFKIQFTKLPGAQESDTNVSVAPFARMTIAGKEVAYGLMDKALDDDTSKMVPLYNQSTQALGSGMMQSNTGNAAQNDGSESTDSSSSSLSIQVIASEVKDNVKREIIDITPATVAGTVTAGSDVNGLQVGASAKLINNSQSYVVRDKDLIIDGDIEIGDTPLSFISYGGNVIIRGNISYAAGSKKPTIALIALQNEKTKVGGEIHIANTTTLGDPLTDLVGTFISERGTLGLSSSNETNLTETERQAELTHQLVINGSIIGGNTLGGGDAPYACPAFIRQALCDIITLGAKANVHIAQKYDLNYLRRFVPIQDVNDLNNNGDIFENHPNYQRSPNNQGSTEPVIVDYYVNKTLLPEELQ